MQNQNTFMSHHISHDKSVKKDEASRAQEKKISNN